MSAGEKGQQMTLELSLGIGGLLPQALPEPFGRPDALFAIAKRAQELSLVDLELHDWLDAGAERPWPGSDEATWYKVQMPDVMGPVAAPMPKDIREKWRTLHARIGLTVEYPNGAICVPWVQRAGRLSDFGKLEVLEGLWCMPLGALKELTNLDDASVDQLIDDCSKARVPICVAPTKFE